MLWQAAVLSPYSSGERVSRGFHLYYNRGVAGGYLLVPCDIYSSYPLVLVSSSLFSSMGGFQKWNMELFKSESIGELNA